MSISRIKTCCKIFTVNTSEQLSVLIYFTYINTYVDMNNEYIEKFHINNQHVYSCPQWEALNLFQVVNACIRFYTNYINFLLFFFFYLCYSLNDNCILCMYILCMFMHFYLHGYNNDWSVNFRARNLLSVFFCCCCC